MSIEIDPREVLEHLEYLGYRSITKEQLKEFVRDLKRLIKYEQCKEKKSVKESGSTCDKVSVACETTFPFNGFLGTPTEFTEQFSSGQRERLYPDSNSHDSAHRTVATSFETNDKSPSVRSYHANDYIEDDLRYKECHNCACSCCKKLDENNCLKSNVKKCSETEKLQPVPSFIRPGTSKPSKCDPVALYHYYQNQWSKRPLPGEDPRTDLRWAVRTRLAHQQQAAQRRPGFTDGQQRRLNIHL